MLFHTMRTLLALAVAIPLTFVAIAVHADENNTLSQNEEGHEIPTIDPLNTQDDTEKKEEDAKPKEEKKSALSLSQLNHDEIDEDEDEDEDEQIK
ncbi:hypothetical protein [Endozoicomonas sp. Mp262]|uniref:hypothetical protein n=1 Tax=Endozoicomonas sp. Mp262 TaxID=2919499 RepID=UPI0021DA6393